MKSSMTEPDGVEHMIGAIAVDRGDLRLGEIRQVFTDSDTDAPTWVGVQMGLFGGEVLVPLDGAEWDAQTLRTAVSRSSARSAPAVDPDEPLSQSEEERLFRHYGIPCVRTARHPSELAGFADAAVSYSVQDHPMASDATGDAARIDGPDRTSDDESGSAMLQASKQRSAPVSGRMLGRTPPPLGESPRA